MPSFSMNQRGQVQQFIAVAVAFVVLVTVVSFGMSLVSNFQGNLLANPQNAVPFNALWPQVVMGFAIIAVLIAVAVVVKNQLS